VLTLVSGGKRGDLVGWDTHGEWHVVEAKGRSSGGNIADALSEAKGQAQNIRLVDNKTRQRLLPATASGCVSNLSTVPITIHARDPDGEPGTEYLLDQSAARESHFDLARVLITANQGRVREELVRGRRFMIASLPDSNVELGVHATVYEAILDPATDWEAFPLEFTSRWHSSWLEVRGETAGSTLDGSANWSVGLDGYFVRSETASRAE